MKIVCINDLIYLAIFSWNDKRASRFAIFLGPFFVFFGVSIYICNLSASSLRLWFAMSIILVCNRYKLLTSGFRLVYRFVITTRENKLSACVRYKLSEEYTCISYPFDYYHPPKWSLVVNVVVFCLLCCIMYGFTSSQDMCLLLMKFMTRSVKRSTVQILWRQWRDVLFHIIFELKRCLI
jgi:hypothetical protein